MARPKKRGLDYFPLDIDFFNDIKIRKLLKYQGSKSVAIYLHLLCNIYKEGYYIKWDKELPFVISEITGSEEGYIYEVVKSCAKVGLFDENLFKSENIITSKGIQERYIVICKQAKRKDDISEFNLVNSEQNTVNSEETPVNSEETPVNSEKSTQSKVKESIYIESGYNYIPSPAILQSENINTVDWKKLLETFNEITGKSFNSIMPAARNNILQILSLGYSKDDLVKAFVNASKDPYLKKNPKLLSLNHITDLNNFERYAVD